MRNVCRMSVLSHMRPAIPSDNGRKHSAVIWLSYVCFLRERWACLPHDAVLPTPHGSARLHLLALNL